MHKIVLLESLLVLLLTSWVQTPFWSAAQAQDGSSGSREEEPPDKKSECLGRFKSDSHSSEVICDLQTEADKFLEWTWFVADDRRSQPDSGGASRFLLDGSMRLNLGKSVFKMPHEELKKSLNTTHKAKIYFPFWPPTSDKNCQFSFRYRVNWRSSFVEGASERKADTKIYPWPRISVVLIRPHASANASNERQAQSLAEVRLLDTIENPASYLANEFKSVLFLGNQLAGSWSLAFLVETKLDANLFELFDMELVDCAPVGDELQQFAHGAAKSMVDLEAAFRESCNDLEDHFQCRLSGRCISLDYRCDFGHDCGPNDDSDEFRCPADYEGRCDFEDSSLCQWIPMPRGADKSWTWTETAVKEATGTAVKELTETLDATDGHNKPRVDHTHQSGRTPGHYLLLQAKQLDSFSSAQLIGPRVQLKANHRDCKFRFWVQTPSRLSELSLKSAQLTVGYERVRPAELFGAPSGGRREESNWRRLQVTLFNRSLIFHNVSIYALHLTFGNLLGDLELFALADGFIALDDFSFSAGCALSFHDQPPASICGDTEFQCDIAPAHTPNEFCIPSNRVCDFKNDCGLDSATRTGHGWSSTMASDEAFCMHWFDVDRSLAFVGRELSGIEPTNYELGLGRRTTFKSSEIENEAFKLQLPTLKFGADGKSPPKLEPFIITAQHKSSPKAARDPAGQASRDIGILLPRFHQAHSNCRLDLAYSWTENSRNLLASIYVLRSNVSTLYKRWSSSSDLSQRRGTTNFNLSLGIGEQNSPFNVFLKISIESPELRATSGETYDDSQPFDGSFSVTRFSFEDCAHQSGVVLIAQAQSVPVGEVDDDGDSEWEDEYRYNSIEAESAATALRFNCPEGQFQCFQPLLCLDEKLVCDMQRDCQESGADELDCAPKGYIKFDFEPSNCKQFEDWCPELSALASSETVLDWTVMKVDHELRARHDLGPPVDHTLGRASGSFLGLWHFTHRISELSDGLDNRREAVDATASVYTPSFNVSNTCRRLMLYVHDKRAPGDAADVSLAYQFSVHYHNSVEMICEETLFAAAETVGNLDGWVRMEFDLPHTQSQFSSCGRADKFSIGFHGTRSMSSNSRIAPLLALDDLTLGPKCELAKGTGFKPVARRATKSDSNGQLWLKLPGAFLLLLCCSLAAVAAFKTKHIWWGDDAPRRRLGDTFVMKYLKSK